MKRKLNGCSVSTTRIRIIIRNVLFIERRSRQCVIHNKGNARERVIYNLSLFIIRYNRHNKGRLSQSTQTNQPTRRIIYIYINNVNLNFHLERLR